MIRWHVGHFRLEGAAIRPFLVPKIRQVASVSTFGQTLQYLLQSCQVPRHTVTHEMSARVKQGQWSLLGIISAFHPIFFHPRVLQSNNRNGGIHWDTHIAFRLHIGGTKWDMEYRSENLRQKCDGVTL